MARLVASDEKKDPWQGSFLVGQISGAREVLRRLLALGRVLQYDER
jgi:hypothetical protein